MRGRAAQARKMKPHTIGEQVDTSAAIVTVRLIGGKGSASKLQSVSLSNNTFKDRIADLLLNITDQVVVLMKKTVKWSYQLHESTDTGKDVQLKVFARYKSEADLEKEFLFCMPLAKTATGADIFDVVDNFYQKEGFRWENCVSVCNDSASAVLDA